MNAFGYIGWILLCTGTAGAKTVRPPLESKKTIRVIYAHPDWNVDSTQVDTAMIMMRDLQTKRLVQIHLDETGPNTGVFAGRYSVDWGRTEKFTPEVYTSLENKPGALARLIDSGRIRRKPFLVRRTESGEQLVEVFDTRKQAESALAVYSQTVERRPATQTTAKPVTLPGVDSERLAREQNEKRELARQAEIRDRERQLTEQRERQKAQEAKRKLEALSRGEIERRKTQADQLSAQAMEAYQAGNYARAESLFRESLKLDPTRKESYFQYGVSLYKVEKYNESLVYLKLASEAGVNDTERKYYASLNYLKLKETAAALEGFHEVRGARHPDLSPSAAFYEGVILFEDRKYEQAHAPFQECLDTSKDPQLDQTAESYIEQIAKILAWENERAKRFIFTTQLGVQYDSNVLQISDALPAEERGLPSDTEAERYTLALGVEWRPVYEKDYEFSTKLFASTQYSLLGTEINEKLKRADVSLLSISAPLRYKGSLFGKPIKLEISAGFEQAMMAIERERDTPILQSQILKIANTMVNQESWYTTYSVEVRQDVSLLESAVGDNDSSAIKSTLGIANIYRLKKSRFLNADVAFIRNNAEGANSQYTRVDLNFGYRQPMPWELAWNVGLNLYQLKYDAASKPRTERNYTLVTGFARPLNTWLQAVSSFTYTKNDSDEEAPKSYTYHKYTALVSLVAAYSL